MYTNADDQPNAYVVKLYNGTGEIYMQRSVSSVAGENTWYIKPGKRLASGMHYITIRQDDEILDTFKVVKG